MSIDLWQWTILAFLASWCLQNQIASSRNQKGIDTVVTTLHNILDRKYGDLPVKQ